MKSIDGLFQEKKDAFEFFPDRNIYEHLVSLQEKAAREMKGISGHHVRPEYELLEKHDAFLVEYFVTLAAFAEFYHLENERDNYLQIARSLSS